MGSSSPEQIDTASEDNGSIDLATDTGIDGDGAVTTESTLGDGPHGGDDGSNDFDVFALTSKSRHLDGLAT